MAQVTADQPKAEAAVQAHTTSAAASTEAAPAQMQAPTPNAATTSQPPSYQPANPMVAQPQATGNKEYDADGKRDWNHGLCEGCCNGFWWLACCLPCLAYGKNRSRYVSLQRDNRIHPDPGGEMFGTDGITYGVINFFTGCGCILEILNRGEVRDRYHIRGNGCKDCLIASFCGPCGMGQIDNELRDEENMMRGSAQSGAPVMQQAAV